MYRGIGKRSDGLPLLFLQGCNSPEEIPIETADPQKAKKQQLTAAEIGLCYCNQLFRIRSDGLPLLFLQGCKWWRLILHHLHYYGTGNSLMDLDIQVSKLKLLKANHTSQKYRLETEIARNYPVKITALKERVAGQPGSCPAA